jgi:HEAT repeat protein
MGSTVLRFVVACAAAAFVAGSASGADDLSQAKTLLAGRTEPSVRSGAELCLKIGTADAMELLMKVLEDDQPHFRDIVWEVIPKFTDAYARQVVAAKMRVVEKTPHLKEWCAQALGEFGVADFLGPLKTALTSTDAGLRAQAARSIGRIKDKSALPALKERLRDEDPFARAEAIEAAARVAPAECKGALWEGLRDSDAGVRCALLSVVPELYPDLAVETAATALVDPDWRPRMQAVENLCAARTKAGIDALLPATSDGRPAVALKANAWLQSVTGMKFTLREQWEPWWKANRATFNFPEKPGESAPVDAKGRTMAAFAGLEVTSDHVVFVIDRSSDMLRTLKDGKTKAVASREALETTLANLPGGVVFGVVAYGAKTVSFSKKPTPLDPKARAAALKFLDGVPCEGRKNIWEVLETSIADGTIDTVYLLSSGEPEVGLYVHWNRVVDHLRFLNRHYKVVFNCVSYSDSKWYRDQIEKIAESTGGKFTARE